MKKLIGITGFARSGKDTFHQRCAHYLEKEGQKCFRTAFADTLKSELDPLLQEHMGISAFTEDSHDKELIRPLLVTYGTELRRKMNPNCWIEKIQTIVSEHLSKNEYVFITDVRFDNEAQWIRMNNGLLVNISRKGIKPANHDEHRQSILMKKYINYNIHWETFGADHLDRCDDHVIPVIAHIIQSQPKFEQVM